MAEITPMMKQYLEIKEQNRIRSLFRWATSTRCSTRMLSSLARARFDADDRDAARRRRIRADVRHSYHSSDAYIARLIAKGYKSHLRADRGPALARACQARYHRVISRHGHRQRMPRRRRGNFLRHLFGRAETRRGLLRHDDGHRPWPLFWRIALRALYSALSCFSRGGECGAGCYDNVSGRFPSDNVSARSGGDRFELKVEKPSRAFCEERFARLRAQPAVARVGVLSYLDGTQMTIFYIKDLDYERAFMALDLRRAL